MFPVAPRLTFGRDQWDRLRVAGPIDQRPIAAWLHGDLQGNLSCQDIYLELFNSAMAASVPANRRVDGNACRVTFWDGGWAQLHSQHDLWQPLWLQISRLTEAIHEFRTYLLNEPVIEDEGRDEGCYGGVIESTDPAAAIPATYHTFFPELWKAEQVEIAAKGAWDSNAYCADETTGAWSGIWDGLEVAGYFDTETGEVFDAYPVINR